MVVHGSFRIGRAIVPSLGLAHGGVVTSAVAAGETLRWADVDFGGAGLEQSVALRREMEAACPALC